jgi:hypothetical protein
MSFKLHQISIVTILLSLLFLGGCEVGHRDYQYVVRNSTESDDWFLLTYSLNGVTEPQQIWLEPGDTFLICERKGVAGDDIWNIETSAVMFSVPSIVAANGDLSRITEELSQRAYWPAQPKNQNGVGVYELQITDDLFVLEKQWHTYYIHNKTDSTIVVESKFKDAEGLRRDTIANREKAEIGSVEIFAYNDETLQKTDKYKERKLSGITSLSIKGGSKDIRKSIDLKKPNDKWVIEPEESTLNVDESVFK